MRKKNDIAIFASGNGSNAEKIFEYFKNHNFIEVRLLLTNNPSAGVILKAHNNNIPIEVFTKNEFYYSDRIDQVLKNNNISLIVLAGFLWLIPKRLIQQYPNKIVNIHPALLPDYGGRGMYGKYVHEAVKARSEKESGITIHYVNENYDEGQIIFQKSCSLEIKDSSEEIAKKVQRLEHEYYPKVIEKILSESKKV